MARTIGPVTATSAVQADRRRFAPARQALEHLRREVCQPQLAAEMPFGQSCGFGKFLNVGELTGIHAPPPPPCPADGPQDVWVLYLVLARSIVCGRHDFRAPVHRVLTFSGISTRIVSSGLLIQQPPSHAARPSRGQRLQCLSRQTGLAMAFKLMIAAQGKWRKLDGRNRPPEIIQGVEFRDGLRQLHNAA